MADKVDKVDEVVEVDEDDTPAGHAAGVAVGNAPAAEPELLESASADVEPIESESRPSPRPKHRDTGAPRPRSAVELPAEPARDLAGESAGQPSEARKTPKASTWSVARRPPVAVAVLVLLAVVLGGAAWLFKTKVNEIDTATNNAAWVNFDRTKAVSAGAGAAIEALFSYDFKDTGKTERAANDLLLTPAVKDKYGKLFAQVKQVAPAQQMVVTTKVSRSGAILLDGDRARVLLFVDQTSIRTADNQTTSGDGQLSVSVQLVDGKWKVTDLDAYTASPTPPPAPPAPAPGK